MPGTGLGSAVIVWNPRMLPVLEELLFPDFAALFLEPLGTFPFHFYLTALLLHYSVFAAATMRMGVLKSRF